MRALCAVACWWLVAEFAVHDRLHGVVEVAETVAAFSTVSVLAADNRIRQSLNVGCRCRGRGLGGAGCAGWPARISFTRVCTAPYLSPREDEADWDNEDGSEEEQNTLFARDWSRDI